MKTEATTAAKATMNNGHSEREASKKGIYDTYVLFLYLKIIKNAYFFEKWE